MEDMLEVEEKKMWKRTEKCGTKIKIKVYYGNTWSGRLLKGPAIIPVPGCAGR